MAKENRTTKKTMMTRIERQQTVDGTLLEEKKRW